MGSSTTTIPFVLPGNTVLGNTFARIRLNKTGNIGPTGLATNGEAFILQNPDLDAETSWNYEIGTKVRYDRYSGGLHLFYNDLTDFITLAFLDPEDDRCADVPPNLLSFGVNARKGDLSMLRPDHAVLVVAPRYRRKQ